MLTLWRNLRWPPDNSIIRRFHADFLSQQLPAKAYCCITSIIYKVKHRLYNHDNVHVSSFLQPLLQYPNPYTRGGVHGTRNAQTEDDP